MTWNERAPVARKMTTKQILIIVDEQVSLITKLEPVYTGDAFVASNGLHVGGLG